MTTAQKLAEAEVAIDQFYEARPEFREEHDDIVDGNCRCHKFDKLLMPRIKSVPTSKSSHVKCPHYKLIVKIKHFTKNKLCRYCGHRLSPFMDIRKILSTAPLMKIGRQSGKTRLMTELLKKKQGVLVIESGQALGKTQEMACGGHFSNGKFRLTEVSLVDNGRYGRINMQP